MLIKSIEISGNKTLAITQKFTLTPHYNLIDCDSYTLKIVENALGSFFKPEIALDKKVWNQKDFEKNAYIQIVTNNSPQKLRGFDHTTTLTLVRKIHQKKIFVITDEEEQYEFSVQDFLNRVALSGIITPTIFNTNVDMSLSWIDHNMIQKLYQFTYDQWWNFIYHGVLCNDRMDTIQDWILNTKQAEVMEHRHFMWERSNTMEIVESCNETLENAEEFALLYKRAETLKAIIEGNALQKLLVKKTHLEYEIQRNQKSVLKAEQEDLVSDLQKEELEHLTENLYQFENLRLTFEKELEDFNHIEILSDDMNYQTFIENFLQVQKLHQQNVQEYKQISEKCLDVEINTQQFQLLYENLQSKVTAINLFEMKDTRALNTFVKSFDSVLKSLEQSLIFYKEKEKDSKKQLNDVLKESEDLNKVVIGMNIVQENMERTIEASKECLEKLRNLKTDKILLERKLKSFKPYMTSCGISHLIPYVEGLVALEALLEEIETSNSSLRDKFLYFLVREITWDDLSNNLFTLECISSFTMIVVQDKDAAQEFLERLPASHLYTFICLNEFNTRKKDSLGKFKRASNRELRTIDHLASSRTVKDLITDIYREILVAPSSEDNFNTTTLQRTLYYDNSTFESSDGIVGGGHISVAASKVQRSILLFLDQSKELRDLKNQIQTQEYVWTGLKETFYEGMYFPVSFNEMSLHHHLDLLDHHFKCKREKKIQEMKIETLKELITWLKKDKKSFSESNTDFYAQQKDLKRKIDQIEIQPEHLLQEKKETYSKLLKALTKLREINEELTLKYDSGKHELAQIDSNINQIRESGLSHITKVIEDCVDEVEKKSIEIEKLYDDTEKRRVSKGKDELRIHYKLLKRLNLQELSRKLCYVNEQLTKPIIERPSATKRMQQQMLVEFPTLASQIEELDAIHKRLMVFAGFFSPDQINTKIMLLKAKRHQYETFLNAKVRWSPGFLENIFIMNHKANAIHLSCILDYISVLSSMCLPNDVRLNVWLAEEDYQGAQTDDNLDLSKIREFRYGLSGDSGYITQELFTVLVLLSICCTFQAPIIILTHVFEMFDSKYWDMIALVLKELSRKRQIIVVRTNIEKLWSETGTPDKTVNVRIFRTPSTVTRTHKEQVNENLDECELFSSVQNSLQQFSFD